MLLKKEKELRRDAQGNQQKPYLYEDPPAEEYKDADWDLDGSVRPAELPTQPKRSELYEGHPGPVEVEAR